MTHTWLKPLRLCAGSLALIAALACSVLPGGFLPKVAGRCGRELCNCAPEPLEPHCALCKVNTHPLPPAVHILTFETSIEAAETPGIALQVVFSGVLAPQEVAIPTASSESELLSPHSALFAISDIAGEILTPPPRA